MNLNMLISLVVFCSAIALALCLWNDSIYTNKVLAMLIFSYITYLIDNEYQKNHED